MLFLHPPPLDHKEQVAFKTRGASKGNGRQPCSFFGRLSWQGNTHCIVSFTRLSWILKGGCPFKIQGRRVKETVQRAAAQPYWKTLLARQSTKPGSCNFPCLLIFKIQEAGCQDFLWVCVISPPPLCSQHHLLGKKSWIWD